MIGKKYLIKQHPKPNRGLNVSEAFSCEMVCFQKHSDLPRAGNGSVGVNANAFPFLGRKSRGTAACTTRQLCEGTTIIRLHQQ